jgi:hypothetical protein
MSILSQLIEKAKELNDGAVQAALARRANQLRNHDLALSLVEAHTSSEPRALREAILAAIDLNDHELFDDFEFALESALRRCSPAIDFLDTPLQLCRRKRPSSSTPIPDRWLPKAARTGAQGAVSGSTKAVAGGPSSAQVEVAKGKGRKRAGRR